MIQDRSEILNRFDNKNLTPLHYAAKYGHLKAAKFLVEQGADLYQKGGHGGLPIHFVVKYRPDVFTSPENQYANNHVDVKSRKVYHFPIF